MLTVQGDTTVPENSSLQPVCRIAHLRWRDVDAHEGNSTPSRSCIKGHGASHARHKISRLSSQQCNSLKLITERLASKRFEQETWLYVVMAHGLKSRSRSPGCQGRLTARLVDDIVKVTNIPGLETCRTVEVGISERRVIPSNG